MPDDRKEKGARLRDIPDEILKPIETNVHYYCVTIMRQNDLLGSGTLVQCGDCHGILTAYHVPFNKAAPFNFDTESDDVLELSIMEKDHRFTAPMNQVVPIYFGRPKVEGAGPDIAFLCIAPGDALGILKAQKLFFNIESSHEERLELCMDDHHGIWAVAGAARRQIKPEEVDGETRRLVIKNTVWFGGPQNRYEKDGFDFIELGVKYNASMGVPESFGGVSGGGLWKAPLRLNSGSAETHFEFESPVLAGVVFYEGARRGDLGSVRCHGPRSVYEKLRLAIRGNSV